MYPQIYPQIDLDTPSLPLSLPLHGLFVISLNPAFNRVAVSQGKISLVGWLKGEVRTTRAFGICIPWKPPRAGGNPAKWWMLSPVSTSPKKQKQEKLSKTSKIVCIHA